MVTEFGVPEAESGTLKIEATLFFRSVGIFFVLHRVKTADYEDLRSGCLFVFLLSGL